MHWVRTTNFLYFILFCSFNDDWRQCQNHQCCDPRKTYFVENTRVGLNISCGRLAHVLPSWKSKGWRHEGEQWRWFVSSEAFGVWSHAREILLTSRARTIATKWAILSRLLDKKMIDKNWHFWRFVLFTSPWSRVLQIVGLTKPTEIRSLPVWTRRSVLTNWSSLKNSKYESGNLTVSGFVE